MSGRVAWVEVQVSSFGDPTTSACFRDETGEAVRKKGPATIAERTGRRL